MCMCVAGYLCTCAFLCVSVCVCVVCGHVGVGGWVSVPHYSVCVCVCVGGCATL